MRKLFTTALLACLVGQAARAQQFLGLSNSNYAGTHGIYLNPSSIADSRNGFYLNLGTIGAQLTNNYASWQGQGTLLSAVLGGNAKFNDQNWRANNSSASKMGFVGGEVRGPSLMLRMSPRHSLAITTRLRAAGQAYNVSPQVAQYALNGFDRNNVPATNNQFNFNANAYSEIGLSYARVLVSGEKHFLKAGVTLKRLAGLYSSYLNNRSFDYRVVADPNNPLKDALRIDRADVAFGYSPGDGLNNLSVGSLVGRGAVGNGLGVDLGVTYENRAVGDRGPRAKPYHYRLGLALMDLGGIRYQNATAYAIQRTNRIITEDELSKISPNAAGARELEQLLAVQPAERQSSFTSGLPTALHVTFDYPLTRKTFVSATLIQSLRGGDAVALRTNSLLSVAPRLEMKWLEIALPITLLNNYQNFALGAMFKLGPITVGSDNLAAVLGLGKAFGADAYVGLYIPIFKTTARPADAAPASEVPAVEPVP